MQDVFQVTVCTSVWCDANPATLLPSFFELHAAKERNPAESVVKKSVTSISFLHDSQTDRPFNDCIVVVQFLPFFSIMVHSLPRAMPVPKLLQPLCKGLHHAMLVAKYCLVNSNSGSGGALKAQWMSLLSIYLL